MLKSLLGKLSKKKVLDLDNDGKVESVKDEIQGLFAQFSVMVDRLDDATGQLNDIVDDENQKVLALKEELESKITESGELINRAKKSIETNAKLREKISEFLPE